MFVEWEEVSNAGDKVGVEEREEEEGERDGERSRMLIQRMDCGHSINSQLFCNFLLHLLLRYLVIDVYNLNKKRSNGCIDTI